MSLLAEIIVQLLAVFVFTGAVLPMLHCDHWTIRGWDFPRGQLFILGLLLFPFLLYLSFRDGGNTRDWIALAMLTIAVVKIGWRIHPYTKIHRKQVLAGSGKTGLRLLVSNVLMTNRESETLIQTIREKQPDLFLALETDQWWTEKLRALARDFPHAVELPQEDTYGMVLRSRIPLIDPKTEYIVRDSIPSIHLKIRLENGTQVSLHAVHPKPPFPDEDTTSTDRDGELLIVAKRIKQQGGPTIVLGDLNDVAWSHSTRMFQRISGMLDPRVGRGLFSTFHAGHWFLRWPLDHVFITDHFRVRRLERLQNIGSDHFPIFADLSFEPAGKTAQETPSADAAEKQEADEKIANALEIA